MQELQGCRGFCQDLKEGLEGQEVWGTESLCVHERVIYEAMRARPKLQQKPQEVWDARNVEHLLRKAAGNEQRPRERLQLVRSQGQHCPSPLEFNFTIMWKLVYDLYWLDANMELQDIIFALLGVVLASGFTTKCLFWVAETLNLDFWVMVELLSLWELLGLDFLCCEMDMCLWGLRGEML